MTALLAVLGDPQRAAPAVHVVGTNGKTSTTRLAAAALASQGRRVGTYTSPHVLDWTERIQVGAAPLGEEAFAAAASAVREASEGLALPEGDAVTQFEALTAMGFHAFRAAGCDALAIEAGLGGRYDATNVLRPDAAVILTNVALEHTELLGDTEAAIAGEKLAVVADGSERLVVGPLSPAADAAVRAECARRGLRPLRYGEGLTARRTDDGLEVRTPRARYAGIPLALHGGFQRDNLAVGLAGAEMVLDGPLAEEPLARGIAAVTMPGRLERVPGAPEVLLDGAHNPAGMAAMVAALPELVAGRPAVAVVSVLADKDAASMLRSLGAVVDRVVTTRSSHARAVAADELARTAAREGVAARAVEGPGAALAAAREEAGPGGLVVVAGSLYLLADLRPLVVPGGGGSPATLARARKGIDPDEAK
jgi:dihydrofolate synthase/folylpolyglutamate synthase